MLILLFLATCFLAYSNGANDNFKGVATLFGSRTTNYRTAIAWATLTTFGGSIGALFLAQTLIAKFSGRGVVPDEIARSEYFILSVAVAAGGTVILATLTGFPVSTTHALTGAIIGSGFAASAGSVHWRALGTGFLLPLLLSPVLAAGLAVACYLLLHMLRLRLGVTKEWCICIGETHQAVPIPQPASGMALPVAAPPILEVSAGALAECEERYSGKFLGLQPQQVMDGAHFLSAGVVSFARGLNDTPKIAAMLLLMEALDIQWGVLIIAAVMAAGGLLSARKVAETMGLRITRMNHGQGLAANLSTGFLVILASRYGLPVSTTHVSVGSLFGIGWAARSADRRVLFGILLSWVCTLPCAALIGGAIYSLATRL